MQVERRKTLSRMTTLCLMAVVACSAAAWGSTIGEKAPPLKVEKWVKGAAVDWAAGAGKEVYVVEFWATWCKPCHLSIPHMTKLQKELGPKGLIVIGVSSEPVKTVAKFVAAQGEAMGYRVAVDDANRTTFNNYMQAFGLDGIPYAFVIDKEGRLVWHGSPFDPQFDSNVRSVLEGKYDFKPFKEADALRLKRVKIQPFAEAYFNELVENGPSEKTEKLAKDFFEAAKADGPFLDQFALIILDHPNLTHRDFGLALKAVTLAHEVLGDEYPDHLEIYAKTLARNGQLAKAIEMQKKAMALVKEPAVLARLTSDLGRYEQGLKSGQP